MSKVSEEVAELREILVRRRSHLNAILQRPLNFAMVYHLNFER